jgi:ADP-ribose pyrophosphatase YjhB (NUDIX family)
VAAQLMGRPFGASLATAPPVNKITYGIVGWGSIGQHTTVVSKIWQGYVMARYFEADRMGRNGRLLLGCSATLFDDQGSKILLTRRADNHRWCLPGGAMEPGESVTEACEREMWEETGLRVRIVRLLGIYSSPHRLLEYADGNRYQLVSLNFEVAWLEGQLQLSDETTSYGYFGREEITAMDIVEPHRERIRDLWQIADVPFIR